MAEMPHGKELTAGVAALVEVARQKLSHVDDRQRVAGLNALRARMASRSRSSAIGWLGKSAFVSLAAGACAVLVLVFIRHNRLEPISFRVEGTTLGPGGYVEAAAASRPVLRFSDGSEVALAEHARMHVRRLDEHGAQVTLDEGASHVYVAHASGTRWAFEAGPFVVAVTGTAFGISWVESERRLDIRLENGSVNVSGPASDAPIALRAGQWLTIRSNEVLIRGLGGADVGTSGDPAVSAQGPEEQAVDGMLDRAAASAAGAVVAAPSAAPGGPRDHRWRAAVASGHFDQVVEEASQRGVGVVVSESSAEDLVALSDAARFTRHQELAREALLTLRRRFPGSTDARIAALSLGRLAEAQGDAQGALSWLDLYLTEAPSGAYASEALGRKMKLVLELSGNDAARPLASAYLRRFPSGTYAPLARSIADKP
jgi:hypothetical protein